MLSKEDEEKGSALRRVQAFLRHVQNTASTREEALATLRAAHQAMSQELEKTRAELERCREELAGVRADYEATLKEQGTHAGELASKLLQDQLGSRLDEIRSQLGAQYEPRVRTLEKALARQEAEATSAWQMIDTLEEEAAAAKRQHETQVEEIRQRHRQELDALAADHRALQEQAAQGSHKVIEQLQVALGERDKLLARSNETLAALQREADRIRASAGSDLETVRTKFEAERRALEERNTYLEAENAKLAEDLQRAESVIASDNTLQRVQAVEQEANALRKTVKDQERLMAQMRESLSILQEVCARSPAARSIIGGAVGGFDVEKIFAPLSS